METVLAARDVTAGYARGAPAIHAITLELRPAELVGVVGTNGAGKSTLLRVLAGLLAPRSGSVTLAGKPLASQARREVARRLSLLPQEYGIELPFTATDVVLMGRYPHARGLPGPADLEAAARALHRCDAWELRDRRINELSGGERRRVALAQSLCQAAAVMLLDEPTSSLDPAHQLAIFDELRSECRERGAAVLVALHDLNLAARFCDRLLVLDAGRLVADAPPEEALRGAPLARALGVELHVDRLPGTAAGGALFVVPR